MSGIVVNEIGQGSIVEDDGEGRTLIYGGENALESARAALIAAAARDEALAYGSAQIYATWADLNAVTGTAGDTAMVVSSDVGTHTDPVASGTVANAGVFRYSASPAGWGRIADLESTAAATFTTAAATSAANAAASANAAATLATASAASATDAATAQAEAEAAQAAAEAARDTAQAISVTGFTYLAPVATATTANITLSGEQTIDGVLTSASRVLVKNQSTPGQNGVYVSAAGAWARATDMDAAAEVEKRAVFVSGGAAQGGKSFASYSAVTTLGTDAIAFVEVADAGAVQDQLDAQAAAKFEETRNRIASAGGDSLKAAWIADAGLTYFSGAQLSSWTDFIGGISAGPHTTIYAGSAMSPRPTKTDDGILFEHQNGFTASSTAILTQTDDFAIVFACDIQKPDIVTYATKAAADAAVGSNPVGTIMQVTDDTNTTYTPDVPYVIGDVIGEAALVNGYYVQNNGTWSGPVAYEVWALIGTGGAYMNCFFDKLGRLTFTVFPGSGAAYTVRTHYRDVNALTGPQIFALKMRDGFLRLWWNGEEIMSVDAGAMANITTFSTCYLNGNTRTLNNIVPVNGWRWVAKAWVSAENIDFAAFRRTHDAIAEYAKCPALDVPSEAWGVLQSGQSWWQGSTLVSGADAWLTEEGWDGSVDRVNATYDSTHRQLSNEWLPRVRCTHDQNNNDDIGPLLIATNGLGNISTADSHYVGSNCENTTWGLFKHLLADDLCPPVDFTISSAGAGGNTIALLSAETNPAPLVQTLKSRSAAAITLYEELLQSVVHARDFHAARGQRYRVAAWLWQQGHSDTGNSNYVTDFLALYDKLNAAIKRITGQSDDVVCVFPQVNYSSGGIGANSNRSAGFIDQKFLDIVNARGTRPLYCLGTTYQITNHIHAYVAGHRWMGENFGKVLARILFDGADWQPLRPTNIAYSTTTVDLTMRVPAGALQFDVANENNVDAAVTFDGVTTYGFEYYTRDIKTVTLTIASPCVVTDAAHGFVNGDRVVLSTTGALPTGLSAGVRYYVVNATTNTYQLSLTSGGAAINTSGTQTGTHYSVGSNIAITAVAITDDGSTDGVGNVRLTLSGNAAAGHVVAYTGMFSRYGNLKDTDPATAFYVDQDWTVAKHGGSPTWSEGVPNDLSNWCVAFRQVLA